MKANKQISGYRALNAASILNKIEENANGNPIGMIEDRNNLLSANFGTEREPRQGGCYKGDGANTYIEFPSIALPKKYFELSCVFEKSNNIRELLFTHCLVGHDGWLIEQHNTTNVFRLITYNDTVQSNYYFNYSSIPNGNLINFKLKITEDFVELWLDNLHFKEVLLDTVSINQGGFAIGGLGSGSSYEIFSVKIFNVVYNKLNSDGSFNSQLLFAKCDENSGDTTYDSSGNGNHGIIINAVTTTPEEDPNSIHQYQDVKSWHNDVGYSNVGLVNSNAGITIPNTINTDEGDINIMIIEVLSTYDTTIMFVSIKADASNNIEVFYTNGALTFKHKSKDVSHNYGVIMAFEDIHSIRFNYSVSAGTADCYINGVFVQTITGLTSFDTPMLDARLFAQGLTGSHYMNCYYDYAYIDTQYVAPINVYIPKDESILLPPFKDVSGNDLQYKGSVPAKAIFKQSSCYVGDGSASYLAITPQVTDLYTLDSYSVEISFYIKDVSVYGIVYAFRSNQPSFFQMNLKPDKELRIAIRDSDNTVYGISKFNGTDFFKEEGELTVFKGEIINIQSATPTLNFYVDGILLEALTYTKGDTFISNHEWLGASYYDELGHPYAYTDCHMFKVIEKHNDVIAGYWPLVEPIIDSSNHLYYDVSGNDNHATLRNGLVTNEGKQDEFHYLQKGLLDNGVNQLIPILENGSAFADGTPLTDTNAKLQDGNTFLDTEAKLQHINMPSVAQADIDHIWRDSDGVFKQMVYEETKFGGWSDRYFSSNKLSKLNQIVTYSKALQGRQNIKEMQIRNTVETYNPNSMVMTFSMAAGETLTIPATGDNDFLIWWGDDEYSEHITSPNPTHNYVNAGDYEVTIYGKMTAFAFNDGGNKLNLISVEQMGNTSLTSIYGMFYGCSNLTAIKSLDKWKHDNITDLSLFVANCSKLVDFDVSKLDVSKIINVTRFIDRCSSLVVLDVSNWDVSKVISFSYFSRDAIKLKILDVSKWDTSSAINFTAFVYGCISLTTLDVSKWNTQNVTKFTSFILNCANIKKLDTSNWNTNKVTSFSYFAYSSGITDIIGMENWNVSLCISFANMLFNVTLSTSRYNAILSFSNGWVSRNLQDGAGASMHFGNSKYDDIQDVKDGRTAIEAAPNNWVITDGGMIEP